jgi:thiol-disulfide isomerase/thioredoxin
VNGWFMVSYIALWVLVGVLVVAILALYNHFGQMYITSREGRAAHGPAEGATLRSTDAVDSSGSPLRVPVPGRRTMLLFVTTDCPLCSELKPSLTGFARAHPESAVVVICAGKRDAVARWGRDLAEPVQVVADKAAAIAAGYGITITPFLAVTDEAGVVLTRGIVNAAPDLELTLSLARSEHETADQLTTEIVEA